MVRPYGVYLGYGVLLLMGLRSSSKDSDSVSGRQASISDRTTSCRPPKS